MLHDRQQHLSNFPGAVFYELFGKREEEENRKNLSIINIFGRKLLIHNYQYIITINLCMPQSEGTQDHVPERHEMIRALRLNRESAQNNTFFFFFKKSKHQEEFVPHLPWFILKQTFFLKFRFNWASCILYSNLATEID